MYSHARATALAMLFLSTLLAAGDDPKPRPAPRSASAPTQNGPRTDAEDALLALNDASRNAYRSAREQTLARCGPVVLFNGHDLVLAYGLYRSTAHIDADVYGTLKTISHIPLALHAFLDGRIREPLEINGCTTSNNIAPSSPSRPAGWATEDWALNR
jgi:hypothetical protein